MQSNSSIAQLHLRFPHYSFWFAKCQVYVTGSSCISHFQSPIPTLQNNVDSPVHIIHLCDIKGRHEVDTTKLCVETLLTEWHKQ